MDARVGHDVAAVAAGQVLPVGGLVEVLSGELGDGDVLLIGDIRRVRERPQVLPGLHGREGAFDLGMEVPEHVPGLFRGVRDRGVDLGLVLTEVFGDVRVV